MPIQVLEHEDAPEEALLEADNSQNDAPEDALLEADDSQNDAPEDALREADDSQNDALEEALLEADDLQNSTGSYLVYNHCKTCFGTVEALPQSEQKVAGRTAVRFHKDESKNDNIFCYAKYGTQFFDYDCLPEGSKCRKRFYEKAFVGKLTGKLAFDNCIFLA